MAPARTLLALAATLAAPAAAHARTIAVSTPAGLTAALATAQPGDTVQLADGGYPADLLIASHHYAGPVTVTGSPAVHLAGLTVRDVSNLTLQGMTLTPPAGSTTRALLTVHRSDHVVIDGLSVDGRNERVGAGLELAGDSSDVTLERSDLTDCGSKQTCVIPASVGLLLDQDTFHDCIDCDFVRGYANGVTIQRSTFDRAVKGACTPGPCNHNDHVQILGGGPWTIVGDRFGDRNTGAASVYVSTATNNTNVRVHDVLVENDLFTGDAGLYAVELSGNPGGGAGSPLNVTVANDTMLSGTAGGVFLLPNWGTVPAADRPLVVNDVMTVGEPQSCPYGTFDSNLVARGSDCSASGEVGAPNLTADGRPTTTSNRLVDAADPLYAPATDLDGTLRVGAPDRGAFEWTGGPLDTTPPTMPGALTQTGATQAQLQLAWGASSDASGLGSYDVSLDGSHVATLAPGTLATQVGHLACGRTYQVTVTASDVAGNVSSPAAVAMATHACS